MKRSIKIIIAALVAMGMSYSAQAHCGNPDKVKSEKIAFITSELDLTPAEAEKFWPVYNQISNEKKEALEGVMKAYKALKIAVKEGKDDAAIKELTNAYVKANADYQAIENNTCEKYRKVLPESKVARLYLAEEKFRRQRIHNIGRDDKDGAPDKHGKPGKGGKPGNGGNFGNEGDIAL